MLAHLGSFAYGSFALLTCLAGSLYTHSLRSLIVTLATLVFYLASLVPLAGSLRSLYSYLASLR